ncbi:MAG: hypothetical protein FWE95_06645 [Planctomycetaceae bacterium]|nr:hypothetical protein [Planctomycetaceae bacterium]
MPKTMQRVEPSEPVPSPFLIGEFIQDAWDIGIKCWQPFLIMGLIVGGFTFVMVMGSYVCLVASILFIAVMAQNANIIGIIIAFAVIGLFVLLVISLIMVWLYAGQVAYSLAIVRGEEPPVSVLFSGMKNFWNVLIAGANIVIVVLCVDFVLFLVPVYLPILYLIVNPDAAPIVFMLSVLSVAFGTVATVIAVMFLTVMFSLTYFFVVDRQQGPIEAMKSSWRFVWAHFWKMLGAFFLIFVFMMVANMIPLVGKLLVAPVSLCLYTVLYLKITGQSHGLVGASKSSCGL